MGKNLTPGLQAAVDVYRKWLHLPDVDPLLCLWGAHAANHLEGEPVWLMTVGPPGSGKTEMLAPFSQFEAVHEVATLTEAALLSGSSAKDYDEGTTGGLLVEIGEFGILVLKDFTSILSMHRDQRSSVLAALREIYDGSWTRRLGTDGGKTFDWEGKLGILAGVTPTIDQHHAVTAAMGERFLMVRLRAADPFEQATRAYRNTGFGPVMRRELSAAAASVLSGMDGIRPPSGMHDERVLVSLAALAARARSAVDRDSRSRQIESIPDPEAPGRIVKQLGGMVIGLRKIGVGHRRSLQIAARLALDSLPEVRRAVVEQLRLGTGPQTVQEIVDATRYPESTARRALEDLNAHRVVDKASGGARGDRWALSPWAAEALAAVDTVPEMSDALPYPGAVPEMSDGPTGIPVMSDGPTGIPVMSEERTAVPAESQEAGGGGVPEKSPLPHYTSNDISGTGRQNMASSVEDDETGSAT